METQEAAQLLHEMQRGFGIALEALETFRENIKKLKVPHATERELAISSFGLFALRQSTERVNDHMMDVMTELLTTVTLFGLLAGNDEDVSDLLSDLDLDD